MRSKHDVRQLFGRQRAAVEMGEARLHSKTVGKRIVQDLELVRYHGGLCEFLLQGGVDRSGVHDVVEIALREQAVPPDEAERLDGEAALLERDRLAVDDAQEPVRDGGDLQGAAR